MKKRGFLFLLVFLITLEISFAVDDLVFSETVYHRDAVEIEGKQFDFSITDIGASVTVDYSGVIIDKGDCKVKAGFNICITNVTFAYKNLTTYEYIYKALVKVYLKQASLSISK